MTGSSQLQQMLIIAVSLGHLTQSCICPVVYECVQMDEWFLDVVIYVLPGW